MNNLCLLTNLTSADVAAWAQAVVGSIAIVVGAYFVVWQVRRGRLQECEREATELLGLARLLVHLRDGAIEARLEKRKLERWPYGHPAEPATRFLELVEAILRVPFENVHGDAAFEALLNARRVAKEIRPLVGPEPELNVNPNFQSTFEEYVKLIDQQIEILRKEAQALLQGKRTIYSVENKSEVGSKNAA
ncbi:MAG: hypothetical protein HOP24_01395 [Sideroxydans sp.]|nr:hypothetical protein [Sideroxydans sp.]